MLRRLQALKGLTGLLFLPMGNGWHSTRDERSRRLPSEAVQLSTWRKQVGAVEVGVQTTKLCTPKATTVVCGRFPPAAALQRYSPRLTGRKANCLIGGLRFSLMVTT